MLRLAIASNLTGWYMAHTGIARDSCQGSTKLKKQQFPYGYCLCELLFHTHLPSAKLLLYYWNNLQWVQSVLWPSPRAGWSLLYPLYWHPQPGSKFDRAYLDRLIDHINLAWLLTQDYLDHLKSPLTSWLNYRWPPMFYTIRRGMGSKPMVAGVSTEGIVVTTPWKR